MDRDDTLSQHGIIASGSACSAIACQNAWLRYIRHCSFCTAIPAVVDSLDADQTGSYRTAIPLVKPWSRAEGSALGLGAEQSRGVGSALEQSRGIGTRHAALEQSRAEGWALGTRPWSRAEGWALTVVKPVDRGHAPVPRPVRPLHATYGPNLLDLGKVRRHVCTFDAFVDERGRDLHG